MRIVDFPVDKKIKWIYINILTPQKKVAIFFISLDKKQSHKRRFLNEQDKKAPKRGVYLLSFFSQHTVDPIDVVGCAAASG
jgi:hypothetical protein